MFTFIASSSYYPWYYWSILIQIYCRGTRKAVVALEFRCTPHNIAQDPECKHKALETQQYLENKLLALLSDEPPTKELAGSNALS